MNVVEAVVQDRVARVMELEFAADELPDGSRMRIGFRPNAVLIASDPLEYRHRATLRHVYFLGAVLRLELELLSGLIVQSQIASEEFVRLGLAEGRDISLRISRHHVLAYDAMAAFADSARGRIFASHGSGRVRFDIGQKCIGQGIFPKRKCGNEAAALHRNTLRIRLRRVHLLACSPQ